MTKKTTVPADKKDWALALYMNGVAQGEIAEKVGVSRQTINKWISDGGWAERRAAKSITRPELANRLLKAIADEIERLNDKDTKEDKDGIISAGVIDKLSKMAAIVERLDKKASVVDAIEVFIAFGKWLQYRAESDPELTPELIKAINRYQDYYVSELLGEKLKG